MRGLGLWEGDLWGWEAGLEALRLYVTYKDLSENPNWILRQKSDNLCYGLMFISTTMFDNILILLFHLWAEVSFKNKFDQLIDASFRPIFLT